MLLNISTTHQPATDLGYLLHKHPDRHQVFDLSFGKAHVLYPEANAESCTASLVLDINPIALMRTFGEGEAFKLEHYVNDRPYVASSFMSSALSKVYGSALNGSCKDRPELAQTAIPLKAELPVLPCRGGEAMLKRLFEPLGYTIDSKAIPLDAAFPDWGDSIYRSVVLTHTITLQELLTHLYVLIPVLDNNKHYFLAKAEVEKLLEKGSNWLPTHPEVELITRRYLGNRRQFTREALDKLIDEDPEEVTRRESVEEMLEKPISLHEMRLEEVVRRLLSTGARTVVDLGCGEGKLIHKLMKHGQFERITGLDVSYRTLEYAKRRLHYQEMSPRKRARIELLHGALTYRDQRLEGFDAAAIVEVIEHLDEPRLYAFERVVFERARPYTVVVTTPNREYNVLFETLPAGKFRHNDHRFEWTRAEFNDWVDDICQRFNYKAELFPIGETHKKHGAPSQGAQFTRIH